MKEGIIGVMLAMMICSMLGLKVKAVQMREQKKVAIVETESIETESIEKTPKKQPKKKKKAKVFKTTAYCPCRSCSGGYGNHTATGRRARARHTIAVDPKVIKYGSKVTIDGVTYTAEDCGGAVKGRHIDIYFNNHADVEKYGVRYKKVRVKQ